MIYREGKKRVNQNIIKYIINKSQTERMRWEMKKSFNSFIVDVISLNLTIWLTAWWFTEK